MVGSRMRGIISLLLAFNPLWVLASGGEEQLEQSPIVIKGDEAVPRTLYIAPWKRVGGPLVSEVPEGNIQEDTDPLERDLFLRELELRRRGYSTEQPSEAAPSPGPGDEFSNIR